MNKLVYQQIDESLFETTLTNGLKLFVIPKKGFQKTYVTLTTRYGSLHNQFVPFNSSKMTKMPEGIAHFLEHKMFEKEQGDMFNSFSTNGASANAFTSYDRTSYLFTAVDNIEANIKLLIKMVQEPYFSKESVEKEIGIIAEEIQMYQDQPNYRLYYQTLQGMYHHHPVKEDIAGSIESINEITAEKLYSCYHTFYRPENMVMFIVGNIEPNTIAEFVQANQYAVLDTQYFAETAMINEPEDICEQLLTQAADVQQPKMMLGIKTNLHQLDQSMIKTELEVMFILDLLFGEQTAFYHELLAEKLIDDTFGYSFSLEPTFSHIFIAGTSKQPDILKKRLMERLASYSFSDAEFSRLVKQTIGEYISSLNSPEYIANQFTRYYFNGAMLFDILPILEHMTLADSLNTFKKINIHQMTDSRLTPNG
ncbi:EF-P 5-aminopentanol modification-associated protein YfmH [Macrococcus lamae]|uniref:Insulinase family protein n=1 Tax=Macrococcus lamae TaxID=198484 RepID=A0A4R6BUB2_9STAP|nr:pitrilysin family protein [Macrococcus lamae]TDM11870.1 insulinase family protein [Macrococcus lamae]